MEVSGFLKDVSCRGPAKTTGKLPPMNYPSSTRELDKSMNHASPMGGFEIEVSGWRHLRGLVGDRLHQTRNSTIR